MVFPPYWTHPHEVSCPEKNDRYTITFWLLNNSNNNENEEDDKDSDSDNDSISILSDMDDWSHGTNNIDIGSDWIRPKD